MPWNEADRVKYEVIRDRYSSDMSDAEFELISPLLPAPKRRGRKPTAFRVVLNAVFYMIRVGCPWRLSPKDFPPFTTVQNRFYAWRDSGLWPQIVSVLAMAAREAEGREPAPTAVVVDSQSVKTTEAGGPRGFDAGKKIKGRKRHIAVDTMGLPIECQITAASVQDRDALAPLLGAVHRKTPWVTMSFVDGGYRGDEAQRAAFEASRISITVVQRTDKQITGFIVLPKRWVVERTLGWINRARRLSKDFEATIKSSLAWLQLAIAFLLMRRLARVKMAPLEFQVGLLGKAWNADSDDKLAPLAKDYEGSPKDYEGWQADTPRAKFLCSFIRIIVDVGFNITGALLQKLATIYISKTDAAELIAKKFPIPKDYKDALLKLAQLLASQDKLRLSSPRQ